MSQTAQQLVGSVVSLWRYPVKSMRGEELDASAVDRRGLLGDRAYAVVDRSDGKVVSAKNPRKWPGVLGFHAELVAPAQAGAPTRVRVTLPDGAVVTSERSDIDSVLSRALGRDVTL